MRMEFSTPADCLISSPEPNVANKSSPLSSDRVSSSMFSTSSFEDSMFDSDDAEFDRNRNNSADEIGTTTRKKIRSRFYSIEEKVTLLRPEEILWFHRGEDGSKKWTAFTGYDSLRLEFKYREIKEYDGADDDCKKERIVVRGGLYEADVDKRKCYPIYWSGDDFDVLRGTWFYDGTYQPLEEKHSQQIELAHLAKFQGHILNLASENKQKGQKPVLHHVKFEDFYIEWNSIEEVYLFSESASSRFVRTVSKSIGLQKSGTRLHRGYCYEITMDDKPPDINHLVFVIHGIGQKMDKKSIVKNTTEIRNKVNLMKHKYFPYLNSQNQRAEFLPVEWRSSLKLDGDTVESITPAKMRGLRTILNSSAMDILYYTSPLYRSEITHSLQTELNKLYALFCSRHPYFGVNGGKVSLIAHSLGAVLMFDILTGWNPIEMYDQFVCSVIARAMLGFPLITIHYVIASTAFAFMRFIHMEANIRILESVEPSNEEKSHVHSEELLMELEKAKKRVNELECLLKNVHEKHSTSSLTFEVDNLFCFGSPLSVFLALRGVRPQGKGNLEHILPSNLCKRFYNIYHPTDPVAYRLEPLILKHYSTVAPLQLHHHTDTEKTPYEQIKSKAIAAFKNLPESQSEKNDFSDFASTDESDSQYSSKSQSAKASHFSFGGFKKFLFKQKPDDLTSEMQSLNSSSTRTYTKHSVQCCNEETCEASKVEQTDLEYRLDYQLKEGNLASSYMSVLTSHVSYWSNKDVAYFLLTHLHPELQDL